MTGRDALRVGVAVQPAGASANARAWTDGFNAALERFEADGAAVTHAPLDMLAADWAESAARFDVVLWVPYWQGAASTSFMKERTQFLEEQLGVVVVPNVATTWHYESKVAQSDLLALAGVPTPRTVATFSADDAEERLAG